MTEPAPTRPPLTEVAAPIGIDARKLGDFGIGESLERLLAHLGPADPALRYRIFHRGPPPAATSGPPGAEWVQEASPPYSLREQWALWRRSREGLALLHLPHYVVPGWAGCPLVVTVHDLIHLRFPQQLRHPPARLYARWMMRRAVARARRIIVPSRHTQGELIELLGVPEGRIAVIPPGRAADLRPAAGAAEGAAVRARHGLERPYAMFAGNLRMPHKDVAGLLTAFARLRGEHGLDVMLLLCGGDARDLRRGVPAGIPAELRAHVRVAGFVPRAELLALYRGAAAFVWPSRQEGFGLPLLEAMACGTPVVATDAAAMPEVLGHAGLLVPPGDPERLAAAIARVLGDAALREGLVQRGLARAQAFSWSEHAARTVAVYREVMAEAGHGCSAGQRP